MWVNDVYFYSPGTLKAISASYHNLYAIGLDIRTTLITNPLTVILFKADFDLALSAIGRGDWCGLGDTRFLAYRRFSKAQQVVIGDILGVRDNELKMLGFYQIPQLRGKAYHWMADFLNGRTAVIARS